MRSAEELNQKLTTLEKDHNRLHERANRLKYLLSEIFGCYHEYSKQPCTSLRIRLFDSIQSAEVGMERIEEPVSNQLVSEIMPDEFPLPAAEPVETKERFPVKIVQAIKIDTDRNFAAKLPKKSEILGVQVIGGNDVFLTVFSDHLASLETRQFVLLKENVAYPFDGEFKYNFIAIVSNGKNISGPSYLFEITR